MYLALYVSFLKIGFSSFGGLSMVPLINQEMIAHGWMTSSELSDLIAIAEMTPGPLGLNCASFAGMRAGGVIGAIIANLGVLTPNFTVALLFSVFFEKCKNMKWLHAIMWGIRPVCLAMVVGVCTTLALSNYLVGGGIEWKAILIGALSCILLFRCHMSIPKVIGVCAVLGLLFYGI